MKKLIKANIIHNEVQFDAFTVGCEDNGRQKTYPCAVKVEEHNGGGHCDNWRTFTIMHVREEYVQPEEYVEFDTDDRSEDFYLQGVVDAWKAEKD